MTKKLQLHFKIKEGYARNPIYYHEVNAICFCGSGLKFKKCCKKQFEEIIPEYLADRMKNKTTSQQYKIYLEYAQTKKEIIKPN